MTEPQQELVKEPIHIVILERHPYYIPASKMEDWREFTNDEENYDRPDYAVELDDTANILIKDYEIDPKNFSY